MPIRADGADPELLSRIQMDGIPVIGAEAAEEQEIHPLRLAIANMMPAPAMEDTEVQWSRLADDPVIQTNVSLVKFDDDCREGRDAAGRERSRTPILKRYTPFSDIKDENIDCLVVTGDNLEVEPTNGMSSGAEPIDLEEIRYREQLLEMIEWAGDNVPVTVLSCLAAHFGLYNLHGIKKQTLDQKLSGVFEHEVIDEDDPIMKGMGGIVLAPHSRWGHVPVEDIEARNRELVGSGRELKILAASPDAGWLVIKEVLRGGNIRLYIQGHPEYDCGDLKAEYERDRVHGQDVPVDYYPDNNPEECPRFIWEPYTRNLQRNILGVMYQQAELQRTSGGQS